MAILVPLLKTKVKLTELDKVRSVMAARQISCTMLFLILGLAAGVDLDCPPFWTRFGDQCYRFFGPPKAWHPAEEHCREFFTRNGQGHLVSIHSSAENDFLRQLWNTSAVPNTGPIRRCVWVGLHYRESEGSFAWSWSDEASMSYEDWGSSEPNGGGRGEDCGGLWRPSGTYTGWNDYRCEETHPYLCKMHANKM